MNDQAPSDILVPLLSRREFTRLAALACAAMACSSSGDGPTAPSANGVTISGNLMTVPLAQNPTLSQSNGFILVSSARVLVVRVGNNEFRSVSSVCTHQGCTVNRFDGSLLTCTCHGSQFNTNGSVARGPAASPLQAFATTFDAASNTIRVTLA
jgi:Rieske Fe-S protein